MNMLYQLAATSVTLLTFTSQGVSAPASQDPTGSNYREWIEYVRPSEQESQWRKISWRNKLMPAVAEARKLNRPVLLWAMNGNPCGET